MRIHNGQDDSTLGTWEIYGEPEMLTAGAELLPWSRGGWGVPCGLGGFGEPTGVDLSTLS